MMTEEEKKKFLRNMGRKLTTKAGMRIAFLTTNSTVFNGRMKPLADALAARGHEIAVYAFLKDDACLVKGHHCVWTDWHHFEILPIIHFNPDLIIYWNGRFPGMMAVTSWLKDRYSCAAMELGWYPQKSFGCLLSDIPQLSGLGLTSYKKGVASQEHHQKALAETRSRYHTHTQPRVELPDNFVFVPLQLEQDTQILSGSPRFKTMESLLGYVRYKFPSNPIVVTNHPKDKDRALPNFVINMTHQSETLPLALKSTVVVGINSTVLSETMLFNKHTISLGLSVAGDTLSEERLEVDPDEYGYRALVLIYNQWDYTNPPEWIIQKVEEKDFRPRLPCQVTQ